MVKKQLNVNVNQSQSFKQTVANQVKLKEIRFPTAVNER